MVVILGTAHGINTAGKHSPCKTLREYKWSREMCRMIKEELCKLGIKSYIDIEDDWEISLKDRVHRVNAIVKAVAPEECIYISVHINAAGQDKWSNASGATVFIYSKASEKSKKLATHYYDVTKEKELLGNRYIPATKYFTANYYVCKHTLCPAILTENLFMTNKKEMEFLMSEDGKRTMCDVHVETIKRYIEDLK